MSESSKITEPVSPAASSAVTIDKNPPAPKRIAWLDAARGICIILVVVGHAINGIQSAGMAAREGILANIYYFIYTFHMAAFFALSGMLAWPSVNKDAKRFFKNSLKHILYPYFLYSTIQILIMNIFSNNLNIPAPFGFFEFRNMVVGHIAQFWFLKTLFLIHIVYLLSKKYSNEHWFLLICIVLHGFADLLPLPEEMEKFEAFAIFYAIGVYFSEQYIDWPSRCRFPLIWAGVFGLLWISFSAVALSENIPVIGGQLHNSLLPASITGTLFVFALSGLKYIENIDSLLYIGRRTLPIFCLHVLFVAGTRIALVKLFGVSEVLVILPAAIVAGLAGPLAIVEIAERFRLRSALGLG
jgi:fucose 4-O-acetylase-like acetyltransferase